MRNVFHEVLRCIGYYILMVVVTAALVPEKARGPLNKISGLVILAALLINLFRLILGGGNNDSGFLSTAGRRLTFILFTVYALTLIACLVFDGFVDLLANLV